MAYGNQDFPSRFLKGRGELLARSIDFLQEVKDKTIGPDLERWLNEHYGVGSELYEEMAKLVIRGVHDGWAADVEIAGSRYRRSQLSAPCAETFFFSITVVRLDSTGQSQDNPEGSFRAGYHLHPYGEINLVVPVDEGAALAGPSGWCDGGWTAPASGSSHFPEVKGGAVISLTFLPAGRIAFDIERPQH